MTVIVKHRETGDRYVVVGTGFGMFRAVKPNWLLGNFAADSQSGSKSLVAVCNAEGEIGWINSSDLQVVSIDGDAPSIVLHE